MTFLEERQLFTEEQVLGRQLRLEEIDDQNMLVADKLHHFRRGRRELLSARLRRNGAAKSAFLQG